MMRKVIGTASGTGSRSFRIAEFEADGVGWEVRFALDSLLEGAGFEPSVSRSREGTSGAKSDLKEGALTPTISALRSRRE